MDSPLDRPFRLTPQTGDRVRAVDDLAEHHNLRGALLSHGSIETSLGRALAQTLTFRVATALGRADLGDLSVDQAAYVEGADLVIPPTVLRVRGEPIRLAGQRIPVSTLGLGTYAVLWEGWRALVGPTTAGRATEPQLFAAVTDGVNKPTATTLHPAGCVDLTNGPSDAPLVTATVQTQRFEQWQYRVRLIPDGDLATHASDLIPPVPRYEDLPDGEQVPGASYTHTGDGLYMATLPDVPASLARAYDRRLYACKLGLVRVGAAGAEVRTHGLTDTGTWPLGAPAPVLPARLHLARLTALTLADHLRRLTLLEAAGGALDLRTNESFAVADETAGGSASARCVPFPAGNGELLGVTHDPAASPAELTLTADLRVRVTASVSFAAGGAGIRGVRLLQDGQPTGFATIQGACEVGAAASVNLPGELAVKAGQRLSLEAVQRSGTVLLVQDARVSVSRVR